MYNSEKNHKGHFMRRSTKRAKNQNQIRDVSWFLHQPWIYIYTFIKYSVLSLKRSMWIHSAFISDPFSWLESITVFDIFYDGVRRLGNKSLSQCHTFCSLFLLQVSNF